MGWAVLVALALLAQPAPAAQEISAEHQPAALDQLLAAKDYKNLVRVIGDVSRPADLKSDLDWLKARMMTGETAFVTMIYSRLLWNAAQNVPEEARDQLKQTAAMTTLYAIGAIRIDGARCGDRSAPAHRLDQIMAWNREVWPFMAALPAADRDQLVQVAVALETVTAARREAQGDVEFLCRAGLEETSYNLRYGTAKEKPTQPDMVGRTIELTGDGNYKPSLRPEAEWRADAAKSRGELTSLLQQFVVMAKAVPAPGAPTKP